MTALQLVPADEHNQALLAQVHPPDWRNPRPAERYDLVVLGGGTAGLVAAAGTAGLGGRVALVERHLLGGDCLNYGCVPSKALLRAARAAHAVRHAAAFGLRVAVPSDSETAADFPAVMERLRRLRAQISQHDSARRFTELGVDVFLGAARFTGPSAVVVDGAALRFKRCLLATGARAAVPDVPGLAAARPLTNETVFSLTALPRRLAVLGGGPIGCELAQAFRRLGSAVTLVQRPGRLLPKDEPEAAAALDAQLRSEGIELRYDTTLQSAERTAAGTRLALRRGEEEAAIDVDAVLVAAGRRPNVEGLNLEAAGIALGPRGVHVNDFLQTTNPRVYAAGDVAGSYQFTHAADAMARLAIQNAFFAVGPFGRGRLSRLVVPWTTYTDPEVAHVGLTPAAAAEQGIELDTYREPLRRNDRAILDGAAEGFAALHCRRGTGRVVGCTLVAPHAGETIGEIALLLTSGLPIAALARTIHCYPTQAEAFKRIGDQYNKRRLTPTVARALRAILSWRS